MYGVTSFTAIIAPPQGAILAVGAMRSEPLVRDGEVRAGQLLSLTLSADHRIMNGVDGAQFLTTIARLLERPNRLMI